MSQIPIGRLIEGLKVYPFNRSMMIDGIPAPGPNLFFTKRDIIDTEQLESKIVQRFCLVVWNMNFIFPYIGNNHPNWLSYCSEGLKPQTSFVGL